jgi:hypothetical protein
MNQNHNLLSRTGCFICFHSEGLIACFRDSTPISDDKGSLDVADDGHRLDTCILIHVWGRA